MNRLSLLVAAVLMAACSGTDSGGASVPDTVASTEGVHSPAAPIPEPIIPPADPALWKVTPAGIGPLRAGMPRSEVETVLSTTLDYAAGSECAMLPLPRAPTGTTLMFVNDTLARVDVFGSSVTATAAGASIGDSAARIDSVYGHRVLHRPHKYTSGEYLVVVAAEDTTRRLLFETDEGGAVTRFRSGRLPEVEWVEACS